MNRKIQKIIFFVVLIMMAVVISEILRKARFNADSPEPSGQVSSGRQSAYGYHTVSPHFRDENGIPYIKTSVVDFGIDYNQLKILFSELDVSKHLTDPANAAVYSQMKTRYSKLFDYGVGQFMDKSINPKGVAFNTSYTWWIHAIGKTDPARIPRSFWTYLITQKFPDSHYMQNMSVNGANNIPIQSEQYLGSDSNYLKFERLYLHASRDVTYYCSGGNNQQVTVKGFDVNRDTNKDGFIDVVDPSSPATAIRLSEARLVTFWNCDAFFVNFGQAIPGYAPSSGESFGEVAAQYYSWLLPQAKQDGFDGIFWDSAVREVPLKNTALTIEYGIDTQNQYMADYANVLATLKPVFQANGMAMYSNGAGVFPEGGNSVYNYLDAVLWEEYEAHDWTGNTTIISSANKIAQFKTNYQSGQGNHVTLFTQNGWYEQADMFTNWKPCGSRDLSERMQTSALAAHYIIKPDPYTLGIDLNDSNNLFREKDMPYRSINNGCGKAASPFLHDESGSLPKSISYNIGRPLEGAPNNNGNGIFATVSSRGVNYLGGNLNFIDAPSTIYKRSYEYGDAYYRPYQIAPKSLTQMGVNLADIKTKYNELSLLKSDGSSDFPLPLGENKCILKNDGSIVGPINKISLYTLDGLILVPCPVKMDKFELSTFDETKSTTEWWADTVVDDRSIMNVDALSDEEMTTEGLTTRPTNVKLEYQVDPDHSVQISYKNKLAINPAFQYDLDGFSAFAINKVGLDSVNLPAFNQAAEITMNGIDFENPIILKNGDLCSDCIIKINSNQTFVFEVSGFSEYSVVEKVVTPTDNNEGIGQTSTGIVYYDPYHKTTLKYPSTKAVSQSQRSSANPSTNSQVLPTPEKTDAVSSIAPNIDLSTKQQSQEASSISYFVLGSILIGLISTAIYLGFQIF